MKQRNISGEEWLRELRVFNLKKRRLTGGLLTVYNSLKVGNINSQLGLVGLFSQITKGRMKEIGSKLQQEGFMLDIQ